MLLRTVLIIFIMSLSIALHRLMAQDLRVNLTEESVTGRYFVPSGDNEIPIYFNDGIFRAGTGGREISGVGQFAVSPDHRYIALLIDGEGSSHHVTVLNSDGTMFAEHRDVADLTSGDQSVKIYSHNDGSFTIRDNIAGFTLFNSEGVDTARLFNSSGSHRGEAVSELRQSRRERLLAVFNPRIIGQDVDHSRIQLIEGDELKHFHTFSEGTIIELKIFANAGRIVTLADTDDGGLLTVFDHGGSIQEQTDVINNPGRLFVTPDAGHAIITSGNRVELYDLETAERTASTVARSAVLFAHYLDESNTLILLTGNSGNSRRLNPEISEPWVYSINTSEKTLSRENLDQKLFWNPDMLEITAEQDDNGTLTLFGLSSPVQITL
jgi:hypothetical protein